MDRLFRNDDASGGNVEHITQPDLTPEDVERRLKTESAIEISEIETTTQVVRLGSPLTMSRVPHCGVLDGSDNRLTLTTRKPDDDWNRINPRHHLHVRGKHPETPTAR